jgi:hypothetical protein
MLIKENLDTGHHTKKKKTENLEKHAFLKEEEALITSFYKCKILSVLPVATVVVCNSCGFGPWTLGS